MKFRNIAVNTQYFTRDSTKNIGSGRNLDVDAKMNVSIHVIEIGSTPQYSTILHVSTISNVNAKTGMQSPNFTLHCGRID